MIAALVYVHEYYFFLLYASGWHLTGQIYVSSSLALRSFFMWSYLWQWWSYCTFRHSWVILSTFLWSLNGFWYPSSIRVGSTCSSVSVNLGNIYWRCGWFRRVVGFEREVIIGVLIVRRNVVSCEFC